MEKTKFNFHKIDYKLKKLKEHFSKHHNSQETLITIENYTSSKEDSYIFNLICSSLDEVLSLI